MADFTNSLPAVVGDKDPGQLLSFLVNFLNSGPFWKRLGTLVIALIIANIPGIVAWFSLLRQNHAIKKLYERMLEQNKSEIERQKDRIKDLENALLKTKRK